MAISVSVSPQLLTPVYNPAWIVCTSSNYLQPNFQFIFDVFVTESNTYVGRFPLSARPVTNNCQYSPNEVLKSYFSYDLYFSDIQGSPNVNAHKLYTVAIGEQYGASLTGVSSYSGLSFVTGYSFNAAVQYEDYPTWTYNPYVLTGSVITGSNAKLLTNCPSELFIEDNQRHSVGFLNYSGAVANQPNYMRLTIYPLSGGTLTYYLKNNGFQSGSYFGVRRLNMMGCGPWNISGFTNADIIGGIQPIINTNVISKYEIAIFHSGGGTNQVVSETKTFNINKKCSKYDTIRFMFLNRLGQYDYFNSTLVSKKTTNIQRNTYKKNLPYNYTVGNRGETVLAVNANQSVICNTDWVTQEESDWLQELFTSNEVYILNLDGSYLPVILTVDTPETKKRVNDIIFNYTITFRYAYDLNIQTG